MTVVAFPGMKVSSFRWRRLEQTTVFKSGFGSQGLTLGSPLWSVELQGVPEYWKDAIKIQSFLESLDGYTNQLELWNLVQPVPAGTMRGDWVLAADAEQGAISLQIDGGSGQAGATLLTGDLIGVGAGFTQQVCRVMQDAAADESGLITVTIGTPLRNAFTAGVALTWNKPKALFRQMSLTEGIEYGAVIGQPWALSLIEDWRA